MFALLSSDLSWCKGHIWCTQAQKNGTYYSGHEETAGFVKHPVRFLRRARVGWRGGGSISDSVWAQCTAIA
jgi:hypothetical protein